MAETVVAGPDDQGMARLSPDGSWILYWEWPKSERAPGAAPTWSRQLMRVPVSGGASDLVLESAWIPNGNMGFRCAHASGAPAPCVLAEERDNQVVFSAFDPVGGRRGVITTIQVIGPGIGWDLSPDGSRIAVTDYDERGGRLRIIALPGGPLRELWMKRWVRVSYPAWTSDGTALFVVGSSVSGEALLHVDLQGVTTILRESQGIYALFYMPAPSPDGRSLMFSETTTHSNAWLLEDF